MKPLITAFHRGITHISMCRIDKVMKKEKNDTNPDSYRELLSACLINCNSKSMTTSSSYQASNFLFIYLFSF